MDHLVSGQASAPFGEPTKSSLLLILLVSLERPKVRFFDKFIDVGGDSTVRIAKRLGSLDQRGSAEAVMRRTLSSTRKPVWRFDGQATKGTRWMPRHQKAKKGVVSCDKLRGAASRRRSGDTRMGKPSQGHTWLSQAEYIGLERRTRGTETSQYPQEKKSKEIPLVVASERGRAQTEGLTTFGVVGPA